MASEITFRYKCLRDVAQEVSSGRSLIIGEVAQTHDGSLGMAHAFIDAIAEAGADAVKFQTHIADEESTPQEPWRVKFSPQDATRYEYWKRMEFSEEQWRELKNHAEDAGLLFLSTPFSIKAADMLSRIGMKVWKVGSGEIGNFPLLECIASKGNPVILSSGMSSWKELDQAVDKISDYGVDMAVLQCTSAYPCPPEDEGLNLLSEMKERYQLPVGLSDHSGKIFAGLAAATLGSEVLEVHVTLSRQMFGPDVSASVTTDELESLVEGTRLIERMMASKIDKDKKAVELEPLRKLFTKSIVAATDLAAGTVLTQDHIVLKKPGTGLDASQIPELIGKRIARDIERDEAVLFEDLDS